MTIITKNSRETQKVAGLLARQLLEERASPPPRAVVLALRGDLGAGKTTFIQGFAKGLGVKEKILSPTFVILKKFQISNNKSQINSKSQISKFHFFYHIDCYRIDSVKEITDLGFKEIAADPKNIVIIEWAERIKKILPKSAVWLDFEWLDMNKRKITIK